MLFSAAKAKAVAASNAAPTNIVRRGRIVIERPSGDDSRFWWKIFTYNSSNTIHNFTPRNKNLR
jgi:hypothetical protein